MVCSLCHRPIPDEEVGGVRWWLSPLSLRLIGACERCQTWADSLGTQRDKEIEARLEQQN